jgi:hypothetical protein
LTQPLLRDILKIDATKTKADVLKAIWYKCIFLTLYFLNKK